MLSFLLEPCLYALPLVRFALAPVPCSTPAISAYWNHLALFLTILPRLQQTNFNSQAQSMLWISHSGVPRGRDEARHPVTPSNSSDEIPAADSHTSFVWLLVLQHQFLPQVKLSVEEQDLHYYLYFRAEPFLVTQRPPMLFWFTYVMCLVWPHLLCMLWMVSWGPKQALHCRRWDI